VPINSEEEALQFIDIISTKHRDATHNVYAYVLGEESNIQRFSDDGEPSGTAGIPVLEVIKKEDLRNVLVVVTRYFGGIKLGGGGLIRAYTKGAKIAVDAGKVVDMTLHQRLEIKIPYTLYGKMENFLMSNGYTLEDVEFETEVKIYLYVVKATVGDFTNEITNLTNGNLEIKYDYEKHLPLVNGQRYLNDKLSIDS
jgi:uncharacterized YigZ family protein